MSKLAQQGFHRFELLTVLRDVLIVWTYVLAAGLILMLLSWIMVPNSYLVIAAAGLVIAFGAVGFAICSYLTPTARWKRHSIVAVALWLWTQSADLSETTLTEWIEGAFFTAAMLVLGVGSSYFLKPTAR